MRTRLLASVRNLDEARLAVAAGADLIDLKAPEVGSLGALPISDIRHITAELGGIRPISATVGDLPMEPDIVYAAVAATFAAGVDYVKVGFHREGDAASTLRTLEPLARQGLRLVAVFFADRPDPPFSVNAAADAGFHGCMLDTQDKANGSLTRFCTGDALRGFIDSVRARRMLSGLAGSLSAGDIPLLRSLEPDYLGFRGALCRAHQRTQQLDRGRLAEIASLVRGCCAPPPHVPGIDERSALFDDRHTATGTRDVTR